MNHRESSILSGNPTSVKFDGPNRQTTTVSPPKLRLPKPMYLAVPKKIGADSDESAPVPVVRFEQFARLERKPRAEFSDECTGSKRTARVDEALGLHERSRRIRVVKVTSEVGLIRKVKRLEYEL
jgi:hypothetical protein